MFAPVYRHLDAREDLFGVGLIGWALILFVLWGLMTADRSNLAVVVSASIYGLLRMAGHGKPDGHLEHLVLWYWRQRKLGGCLSAAARRGSPAPAFPFNEYEHREVVRALSREGGAR